MRSFNEKFGVDRGYMTKSISLKQIDDRPFEVRTVDLMNGDREDRIRWHVIVVIKLKDLFFFIKSAFRAKLKP